MCAYMSACIPRESSHRALHFGGNAGVLLLSANASTCDAAQLASFFNDERSIGV